MHIVTDGQTYGRTDGIMMPKADPTACVQYVRLKWPWWQADSSSYTEFQWCPRSVVFQL